MIFGLTTFSLISTGLCFQLQMGLDPVLTKNFPRDFSKIPLGTDYGTGKDAVLNKEAESRRLDFLESDLLSVLTKAVTEKERPIFTTALIAGMLQQLIYLLVTRSHNYTPITGDCVILDAIHKAGLLSKVPIIFVDTYTLFPETLAFLREVEAHYGFKSEVYAAAGVADQQEYYNKYGRDYWMKDIDKYDMLCKVEPMNRALKEKDSDCWINGRRRDHGAERAALPVWEGKKVLVVIFRELSGVSSFIVLERQYALDICDFSLFNCTRLLLVTSFSI